MKKKICDAKNSAVTGAVPSNCIAPSPRGATSTSGVASFRKRKLTRLKSRRDATYSRTLERRYRLDRIMRGLQLKRSRGVKLRRAARRAARRWSKSTYRDGKPV